jgi:ligand-binding SRPBCC domain-containing protein
MIYRHRFTVAAPLARVVEFHRRAAGMSAITPPPIIVQLDNSRAVLGEDDAMGFTMWFGPLPVRWLAHIEKVSENGFTDRQLQGPFA